MDLDRIINSKSLRPYFFKFISRKFVLGLAESNELHDEDYFKLEREMQESLYELSNEISRYTDDEPLEIVSKVSWHYLSGMVKWKQND